MGPRFSVIEVGELAVRSGCGVRVRGGVEVDLNRLQREFARLHRNRPHDLYVGHLAHLLPIRDAIVLRCHPVELAQRLARARRGSPSERAENAAAEAIDLVLREALRLGRRVWEVDTSGRSPTAVAQEVARRWRRRGPPRFGTVDWLADPSVTDYLLDRGR
jgi:broad-specificity NMP kinase